ncbi:MAG: hypothetical protein NC251_06305 [Lachnoclostridium sp.]|nr:hypothetical protein [Lachnospira sp.]MCM1248026.1 hypothetical protein [Lachnoclostridium sp.]
MNDYRVTVGVEATNDYDKARQDVLQARNSVCKLPPQQQWMLMEELVGAASVASLLNLFQQAFVRRF